MNKQIITIVGNGRDRSLHIRQGFRFTLIAFLFISTTILFAEDKPIVKEKPSLVILPFDSNELNDEQAYGYTENLTTKLQNKKLPYNYISKSAIKQAMDSIKASRNGLYSNPKKFGNFKSEDKLLLTKFSRLNDTCQIDVQIVDVGTLERGASASKPTDCKDTNLIYAALQDIADEIGNKIHVNEELLTNSGVLWRSAILPGFGQFVQGGRMNETPKQIKGGVMIGVGLILFGNLYSTESAYKTAKSNYDSASNLNLAMSLTGTYTNTLGYITYVNANNAKSTVNGDVSKFQTASLLFLGYYIYNLIDAYYLSGGTSSAMLESKNGFHLTSYNENYFGQKNVQTNLTYQFRF